MHPMRKRTAWSAVLLLLAIGLAALGLVAPSSGRALSFVVRSAGIDRQHPTVARWWTQAVTEADEQVPTRDGPMPARWYRPARRSTRTALLVPGVNAMGIDEPRLIGFARTLAATGLTILTVATPDLARYQVTPRTTDMIEDAALWLAGRRPEPDGRIGMMGISFAGGLSVVTAGRPSLRDRVAFVFSFGGYADFLDVLRFLCTGIEPLLPGEPAEARPGEKLVPGGVWRAPHDYGVAVLALDLADHLVPPDQVEPLREAILTFLHASHLALYDQKQAAETFERARRLAAALPEPAATIMRQVNDRNVAVLGPRLLPFTEYARDPALSPIRSPAPRAPVYLLHGADDNVIPARETEILAYHLQGKTQVHALLSRLISHAEVDRTPTLGEVWRLVGFWASLFRQ
jgi:dienelactone hydrolase